MWDELTRERIRVSEWVHVNVMSVCQSSVRCVCALHRISKERAIVKTISVTSIPQYIGKNEGS